ncbi:MAG: hypothetical protein NVSMB31_04140 [Vulcanimicrobiaceae bacterium]
MLHFPLKRTLLVVGLIALLSPLPVSGATDKQLQRERGTVSYQNPDGTAHAVSGRIVLADDALALTGRASAATLSLPDSSVVALGENTRVKVGAFNSSQNGPGSTITVEGGALKFAIRHPAGGRSNYTFQTPTSQIAVRGTDGYLVVGVDGTQVVCTQCEPGDVRVTVLKTGIVTALVTGQVLTILNSGAGASGAVTSISNLNSPAVNQFSNGLNPFGNTAASADVTGSASGATAGAATTAAAGVSVGALAGGALASGLAVSAIAKVPDAPIPAALTVTPASFNFNAVGQTQMFSVSGAFTSAVSANTSIATVSSPMGNTFIVRAVSVGATTIAVSAGGLSTTVSVTVTGAVVTPARIHQ